MTSRLAALVAVVYVGAIGSEPTAPLRAEHAAPGDALASREHREPFVVEPVATEAPAEPRGTDRVMIRLAPGTSLARWLDTAAARDEVAGAVIVTHEPLRAILRARSGSPLDAQRLADRWARSAGVDYAAAERFWPTELRSRHEPNDPLFADQWPLDNRGQGGGRSPEAGAGDVNAPEAWAYTLGSPDVLIAVLDDGVQLDHPDLVANIASTGRDFTQEPPGPSAAPRSSADLHGTSVAGVLAARGDNRLGVSGICPRCRILPIRVHGSSNLGTAAAFRYAVEQGADIITNSWGYTRAARRGIGAPADDPVRDAIDGAAHDGREGLGTLIVFGTTNDTVDNCRPPDADISALASVVAVGVANHYDEVGGSGFGTCLDLVAPSKPEDRGSIGVPTTDRTGIDGHTVDDYYAGFGGTSAAAPLVAGIAGLLLSLNPAIGRAELQRILEHTADKIDAAAVGYDDAGFSERAGYGRVNAARALVPSVQITVAPARVAAGEPFSVTVTASAPFGLQSVRWDASGAAARIALDSHERALHGEYVASFTWSALAIETPGTYTLTADARDVGDPRSPAGYPHRASELGTETTARLTVVERADADSR